MTRSLYLRIAMLLMLTAPCLPLLGQNSPFGACSFVVDSSGATSDAGVSISLTFGSGGTLSFVGSGSTQVSDQGTYSVSGNSITISLPDMSKSAHGLWTLQANVLTLPFQLFSNDAGTSKWICIASASSGSKPAQKNPPPSGPGQGQGSDRNPANTGNQAGNQGPGDGNDADPANNGNSGDKAPSKKSGWQSSPFAPYMGDWVGIGWGWEVRFKSGDWNGHPNEKNSVMTLTVRHLMRFNFTIDAQGQVVGNGEVTYDLDPNLCGVYKAAEQINMAIDVLKNFNSALSKMRSYATQINQIFGMKSKLEEAEAKAKVERWEKFSKAKNDDKFGVTKTHTSPFENMGHKAEDIGDVAASVWYQRCTKGTPVQIVDGPTCDELPLGPPSPRTLSEEESKSTGEKLADFGKDQAIDLAKDTYKKLQEKDPNFWNHDAQYLYTHMSGEVVDAATEALKEKAKKTLNVFDVQEQPGKDECAGIPSTRAAGNSFNTPTAASLMQSWNEFAESVKNMNPDAAVNVFMNAPGVTKVQYDYKGLEHGPESRRFKIKGYVSGDKIYLRKDGDVYEGDTNLTVQYTVNLVTTKKQFPTWSPFIDDAGADLAKSGKMAQLERISVTCDVKPAKGEGKAEGNSSAKSAATNQCTPHEELQTTYKDSATPFATFYKTGEHRNNVQVWHEYEYSWNAFKVTEPLSISAN